MHSGYLYSTSSSPLLLRSTPDYIIDTVSELTYRSATGNCDCRTCQGPYVAVRVGFEPAKHWTQGTELTTEPQRPNTYIFQPHRHTYTPQTNNKKKK